MDWSAHNAGFVIAAYVLSGLSLAGLIGFIVYVDRRNAKAVKDLKD